jgi:hypothetical protein
MRTIDYTKLREGQMLAVASATFVSETIKMFEYPKDYKGIEVSHNGVVWNDGKQWLINEEGRYAGLVNTPLDTYLSGNDLLVFQELNPPMTSTEIGNLHDLIAYWTGQKDTHYRVGGIWEMIKRYGSVKLHNAMPVLFPDTYSIHYKVENGVWICSESSRFLIGTATARLDVKNGVSPADNLNDPKLPIVQIINPS